MNTKHLTWKNNKLYNKDSDTGYFLVQHGIYPKMFYSATPTGNSKDFYNIIRAKQHTQDLYTEDHGLESIYSHLEVPYSSYSKK